MKRTVLILLLMVLILAGSASTASYAAQENDLPATVEALETRVAELEESVVDLETRVAASAVSEAQGEPSATEVPVDSTTGDGTSLTSPIGVGSVGVVDEYEVRVMGTDFDAEAEVLQENQFNEPAHNGYTMVMPTLEVKYIGTETGNVFWDLSYAVVGNRGLAYKDTNEANDCGSIPNDAINVPEMFPGAVVELNVCWQVPDDEADSLIMVLEPLISFDGEDRAFFHLGAIDDSRVPKDESIAQATLPTTVNVELVDLAFIPNEISISANTDVTINVTNNGALPHTFTILGTEISTGDLGSGASESIVVNVDTGVYELVCDVPGHEDAGMVGTLVVN